MKQERGGRLIFEMSPDGENIERAILDPVSFTDDEFSRIIEGQINSVNPKQITTCFRPGISISPSEVLVVAKNLKKKEKKKFIQDKTKEMRNANIVIIGNPPSDRFFS